MVKRLVQNRKQQARHIKIDREIRLKRQKLRMKGGAVLADVPMKCRGPPGSGDEADMPNVF